jgi:hypothetical protein
MSCTVRALAVLGLMGGGKEALSRTLRISKQGWYWYQLDSLLLQDWDALLAESLLCLCFLGDSSCMRNEALLNGL